MTIRETQTILFPPVLASLTNHQAGAAEAEEEAAAKDVEAAWTAWEAARAKAAKAAEGSE